jgi:predicted CopG family antitoxin
MSHQVRLDDDVYERIKSQKRDDETFSEAIERLTSEWTLLDFAAGEPVVDAETHRAALDESEQQGIEDTRDRLERMGVEVDE